MVYVTSMPIHEHVIEYYLSLLPGVIPSHARARLTLVSVGDSSPTPLTDKLLERPRLLARIASLVPDPARSHLLPYNSTTRERDLSLMLGIPMYAADPRLYPLGTKTGCRRVFAEAGVAHPFGAEDLHSVDDVVDAVLDLHAARPAARWAMVKLNEGVSGSGNALVDLAGLPAGQAGPGSGDDRRAACPRRRAGARDAARGRAGRHRRLPAPSRGAGRDRRGARRRRRGAQSQRAAAGDAPRGARDPLDARPDPRRPHGPDLPRGALPGRPGLRDDHHRRGGEGRSGARRQGCPRALRPRLRRRPARDRLADARHRDQPAPGRHDAPVPDPAVPDRRRLRPPRRDGSARRPGRSATSSRPTTSRTRRSGASVSTTSSTSSRGPACTSTSRARPASSST